MLAANHGRKSRGRRTPKYKNRHNKTPPPEGSGVRLIMTRKEECFVLGRPGSDLLSQGLSHSTNGAEEFNGRVRDGIGFMLLARTTRPAKDNGNEASVQSAMRSGLIWSGTLQSYGH